MTKPEKVSGTSMTYTEGVIIILYFNKEVLKYAIQTFFNMGRGGR